MAGIDRLAAVMGRDNDLDQIERDNICADAAADILRLRNALQKIAAMTTMPSHAVNTVTLVAARAIAKEALGHKGTEMVRPQITG